jgi:hypothetical protein
MRLRSISGAARRRLTATALSLSLIGQAADGACQANEERAGARAAAVEGAKAFNEKRWADAIDFFKRAESLVHAPPHVLYMARAQKETGLLVEARENLLSLVHEELKPDAPQVFRNAKDSASEELKAVEARLPYVTVTVTGAGTAPVTLTQDGTRISSALLGIPRPVNPGSHKFEATATGLAASATVQISESAHPRVTLELAPSNAVPAAAAAPPPEATPASPTPGADAPPAPSGASPAPATADSGSKMNPLLIGSFVGFGVGVAGLAVGTVFTLKASSKTKEGSQLFDDNNCAETGCPDQKDQISTLDDQASSARKLGIVGFVVGGVGVASGVTLFLLSRGKHEDAAAQSWPSLNVAVGPGSMRLYGAF